jgi:hypothetical protein
VLAWQAAEPATGDIAVLLRVELQTRWIDAHLQQPLLHGRRIGAAGIVWAGNIGGQWRPECNAQHRGQRGPMERLPQSVWI